MMGLPIRNMVVASSEDNTLHKFMTTGVYDVSYIILFPR